MYYVMRYVQANFTKSMHTILNKNYVFQILRTSNVAIVQ